ncbi:MAG: hypothetical protein ACRELV_07485, partial [Longimicrobiales bacterium]
MPSAALGLRLEDLERPDARKRRAEGRRAGGLARHGQLAENFTASKGNVRDIVGASVGMSAVTYRNLS